MSSIPHYSVTDLAFGRKRIRRDDAWERASAEASAEIVADFKANLLPPDPRSRYEYASLKQGDKIAVPVVKLGDRDKSIVASLDGGEASKVFLSRQAHFVRVQPESDGDFLLILVDRAYCRKVFGATASSRELSTDRAWTHDERARWQRVTRFAARINHGIASGGRTRSTRRFGETA